VPSELGRKGADAWQGRRRRAMKFRKQGRAMTAVEGSEPVPEYPVNAVHLLRTVQLA